MAASARRDLYLQVSGNVTGLSAAMKTGRSLVNEFGSASINVLDAVEKKFGEIGNSATPGLKQVEQAYDATFKRIRQNAQAIIEAPSGQAAIQIVDAEATRRAADAADSKARAFRAVAEAATRADQAQNGQNAAVRAYAVAAATAAVEAEAESRALREQAAILGLVEGNLENVSAAQRKQVAVSGQQRAGFQQLSYQLGDISTQYASGTAVSMIFAQQSAQVIQAIQLISGESKGLIGLLGGPWGIAFAAALVALTPFVGKILEGTDALAKEVKQLEENADKAALADRAKEAFRKTEKGMIDDVRQLTSELHKQNDALRSNAELQNVRAKEDLAGLQRQRAQLIQDVTRANLNVASANAAPVSADGSDRVRRVAASQAAQQLTQRLAEVNKAIEGAEAAVLRTRANLADEAAKRAIDPLEQIRRRYEGPDGLIAQAQRRAIAEKTVTSELTRQITVLRSREKAELDREQKRQSASSSTGGNNNQIGRTVTVAEATQIAASIGGKVTSGVRSREKQEQLYADKLAGRHAGPVAKPGTSDHERGQAIDIQFAPGLTVAKIREAFAKEGVAIRQLLVERDQRVFHVAFGPKGKSAEAQQQATDRDALQGTRETIAIHKLADVSEFFDPGERKAAAEKAARDLAADFRAIFGEQDLLGDAVAKGDANLRELVDQAREVAQEQADKPLNRYRAALEENVGDTARALQEVETRGLESLEDGLIGIISGTESVGSAFSRMAQSILADLARIAVQKAVLKAIGGASFFGLADGGKISDLPGFADGGVPSVDRGLIRGPGDGRSDSILALVGGTKPIRVSNGEAIVNERGVRKHWALIDAINKDRLPTYADGGLPGMAVPTLPSISQAQRSLATNNSAGAGGTLMVRVSLSEDLHATIDSRAAGVAVQVVRATAPEIVDAASAQTMAAFGRPSI